MANIGNHTFIDGVGDIRLRDGVIRMDLLALSPTTRDKEGNPVPQFVEQLVMSPAAFGRMVGVLAKRAGIDHVRPHGLRHAAITAALDASGGDLRAAQRFSRHRDPRTLCLYDDNRKDLGGDLACRVAASV